MNIEYTTAAIEEIDIVKPLWEKLNELHGSVSRYFSEDYPNRTWEARKKELLDEIKDGGIRIDLAGDGDTGELTGYCISSVKREGLGEIDSIYIEPDYRYSGIGDTLMKRALRWMEEQSVKRIIVQVADGNEEVHPFYNRYGFNSRSTILMRISDG